MVYTLSVIAGGGTYCYPRPGYCTCPLEAYGMEPISPSDDGDVPHDYPGPYVGVEVWLEGADKPESMSADTVRAIVAAHGGES